jgi:hypothetical protein
MWHSYFFIDRNHRDSERKICLNLSGLDREHQELGAKLALLEKPRPGIAQANVQAGEF